MERGTPRIVQTVGEGEVTEEMASIWKSSYRTPVDCGEAQAQDPTERKRNPRFVACSEALTKLAQTATIDAVWRQLGDSMALHQLGCGVPDGAATIAAANRTWESTKNEKQFDDLLDSRSRQCWKLTWRKLAEGCTAQCAWRRRHVMLLDWR